MENARQKTTKPQFFQGFCRFLGIISREGRLLVADTIGRNLTDPDGIPAGIMAAFIGTPYFIYLLLKK